MYTRQQLVALEGSAGLKDASAAPLRRLQPLGCSGLALLFVRNKACKVLVASLVGLAGGTLSLELHHGFFTNHFVDSYASGELLRGCSCRWHLVAGMRD
jgi:hypothetical protein